MLFKQLVTRHKAGTFFGIYMVFCIFSLGLSTQTILLQPKEIGLSLFSLAQNGISSVGTFFVETITSVQTLSRLKSDYSAALERLKYYERIEKQYQLLEEENTRLKEVLNFSQGIEFKSIPAKIIGKDPENFHSTITINMGSMAGIEKNMPVVAVQNGKQGLVGKVAGTGMNSSVIQPLYDPSGFVAARLLTSRYEGLVNGSGEESVTMKYVKRYARSNIRYGDMVITSGMNSLYPSGIFIGAVKAIHAREYDTSLELELEPVIDFSRLEYVFVLQPRAAGGP